MLFVDTYRLLATSSSSETACCEYYLAQFAFEKRGFVLRSRDYGETYHKDDSFLLLTGGVWHIFTQLSPKN
jgi:hypothetical protein